MIHNIQPPDHLDPITRDLYTAVVLELQTRGTYAETILPMVESYCTAVAAYRRVCREIAAGVESTTRDRDAERLNPLFRLERSYFEQINRGAKALGISPEFKTRWTDQKPAETGKTIMHLTRGRYAKDGTNH